MRIKNTSRFPDAEVRALVEFGMKGVNTARLAVHVKNYRRAYRGRAYYGVPHCSPRASQRTVDRLVTIGIGAPEKFPTDNLVKRTKVIAVDELGAWDRQGSLLVNVPEPGKITIEALYPYGGKTAPKIEYRNWQEALVGVAAHEARHVHQFQHNKPRSEVDCERFAAKRLAEYRTAQEARR